MIHDFLSKQEALQRSFHEILEEKFELELKLFKSRKKEELLNELKDEFREQSQKLLQLDTSKNQYSGLLFHQLKNNITMIQSYCALFLSFIEDGFKEDYSEFIQKAFKKAEQTNRLINDFLDIHSIENGEIKLAINEFEIEPLISEICLVHEGMARLKDITLHFTIQPSLSQMKSDALKISQILSNLISNAVLYSSSGSDIYIQVKQNSGFLELSVEDEGKGLSDEELRILTESKNNGDQSAKGYGLAIVKKLVSLLEGRFEIETQLQQGTTITVFLPLKIMKRN